jgi:hypothetical protein
LRDAIRAIPAKVGSSLVFVEEDWKGKVLVSHLENPLEWRVVPGGGGAESVVFVVKTWVGDCKMRRLPRTTVTRAEPATDRVLPLSTIPNGSLP